MTPADLPPVNATLNAISAVLLLVGWRRIRRGDETAHRRYMIAAFVTSALFLACYLTYHGYNSYYLNRGPTVFREPAGFRPVYLAILLTHTVIAAAVLPLALLTLFLAWKKKLAAHKKIARWTWPLWMYVSVTGVVIYLLLYQIFPQTPAARPEAAQPAAQVSP